MTDEQETVTTEQEVSTVHKLLTVTDAKLMELMQLWNKRQKREHVYVVSYEQMQEKRSADK